MTSSWVNDWIPPELQRKPYQSWTSAEKRVVNRLKRQHTDASETARAGTTQEATLMPAKSNGESYVTYKALWTILTGVLTLIGAGGGTAVTILWNAHLEQPHPGAVTETMLQSHVGATHPGSVTDREYTRDRQLWMERLNGIEQKLDRLLNR